MRAARLFISSHSENISYFSKPDSCIPRHSTHPLSAKQQRAEKAKEVRIKKEAEKKVELIRQKKKEDKKKEIKKPEPPKPVLKIGDRVRMHDGRAIGSIDAIEKGKATVNYGMFTTHVTLDLLELVEAKK